ncbi:N-acetylmuramoyl-L-alanine amidase [Microbulbifer rhizosphaerae]|uniref:N-acetylmuramoyl-L-alanine amidase n=1 Tax=Microbulbifer rhizosphaerae TaxID=1562603 RepID=A0A7W4WE65_9GAMM|nr:peptidoglycan recognition family protein [Microbulbifer rhizosphaerae]MBB3062062.1 N-acetyl-anhydromuramyl-L-alanine amidase AmpD [Microbulbifer rhizosphaerae]
MITGRMCTLLCLGLLSQWAIADGEQKIQSGLRAQLAAEEQQLLPKRQEYIRYFNSAYAAYPSIPDGTLEAIAYVQTRWMHLDPDRSAGPTSHQHMPKAYGVMGLYGGGGFEDQISLASAITGIVPEKIKRDPEYNILAAAALLDAELREDADRMNILRGGMLIKPKREDMTPILKRYAGFSPYPEENAAQEYVRNSFAYDVLLAQDRGVDDRGIKVPENPVSWERAFSPEQLTAMRAPFVRLDVTEDILETREYRVDPITKTLQKKDATESNSLEMPETGANAQGSVSIQSTDYGPARWVPSPYYHNRSSYDSTTIHTAEGTYAGTISWFQNNPRSVSAHYVIRSSDGQVTQMVRNHNAAHHVGIHNGTTLGIEHEGYVDNSSWYTNAMYNSSAALVKNFCGRYAAIDCSKAYNGPAHSSAVVLSSSIDVKGHQHYTGQDHTDPGINWNWSKYYSLLNDGSDGNPHNPYAPEEICGSGYEVIDSHALSGGRVYLLYNSSNGYNCAVTLKTLNLGSPSAVSASLQVKGETMATDSGNFSYYAGPVKRSAPDTCVKWGGSVGSGSYMSEFEHCG